MSRRVTLGGKAPGPMPSDGRAYVVVGGKWVAIAHDETDGVPAQISFPERKSGTKGVADGSATSV